MINKEDIMPIIGGTLLGLEALFLIILMISVIITTTKEYEIETNEIQIVSIETVNEKFKIVYIQDGIYKIVQTKNVYSTQENSFIRKKYKYNSIVGEIDISYEFYINEYSNEKN